MDYEFWIRRLHWGIGALGHWGIGVGYGFRRFLYYSGGFDTVLRTPRPLSQRNEMDGRWSSN